MFSCYTCLGRGKVCAPFTLEGPRHMTCPICGGSGLADDRLQPMSQEQYRKVTQGEK